MGSGDTTFELRVQRACLVCDFVEELWEAPHTDTIGGTWIEIHVSAGVLRDVFRCLGVALLGRGGRCGRASLTTVFP